MRERGFTLIEMLVVVLVMGLLAGLAAAALRPAGADALKVEAERLARLLDLAGEEARLGGKPVAWTSNGQGYQFWRWRNGVGWMEIRDNDALRERRLAGGSSIAGLRIDGVPVRDGMRLEFSPYGTDHAYAVTLAQEDERYAVLGSPVGEVSVVREAAAAAALTP